MSDMVQLKGIHTHTILSICEYLKKFKARGRKLGTLMFLLGFKANKAAIIRLSVGNDPLKLKC